MKGIIVYTSKYGATAQYAMWLSEKFKIPMVDVKLDPDVSDYKTVIVASGVYMGRLKILKWLTENEAKLKQRKTVVLSVSASQKELDIPFKHFALPGRLKIDQLNLFDRLVSRLVRAKEMNGVSKKELDQVIRYIKEA